MLRIRATANGVADVLSSQVTNLISESVELNKSLKGLYTRGQTYNEVLGSIDKAYNYIRSKRDFSKATKFRKKTAITTTLPDDVGARTAYTSSNSYLYEDCEWGLKGLRRRPSDIHIVTFPRSGTTWMQMLLFQLLTPGDLNKIEHMYQFSPFAYCEMQICASTTRIDKLPDPRVLKTHFKLSDIYSPSGKYIYITRSGVDVARSGFYFQREIGRKTVPFDIYFDRFLTDSNGWFDHVKDSVQYHGKPNLLFLTYSDMSRNFADVIRRVATFIEVDVPKRCLKRISARCTLDYMKRHEPKFHHNNGLQWIFRTRNTGGFIRTAAAREKDVALTFAQIQQFREIYRKRIGRECAWNALI